MAPVDKPRTRLGADATEIIGRYPKPRSAPLPLRHLAESKVGKGPAVPLGAFPPALLRRGAGALAAGRVALGLAVLARPPVLARPWVGAAADDLATQVFGRALGARDLVLGLGALTALRRPATEPGSACVWVAAGALSDALDAVNTLSAWRKLPSKGRWLIVTAAAGWALAGAAAALALRPGPGPGRGNGAGTGPS